MAAPAGSGAVEAYKTTAVRGAKPSVSATEFVPRASADVAAKSDALRKKVEEDVAGATSGDPFKKPPPRELPPGTYGGKKSRRKSRRRGGAMGKSVAQLLNELDDDPSEASLRNVLSELKESGHAWTVAFAHSMEKGLNDHKAAGTLTGQLIQAGIGYVKDRIRKGRIKDGGRRKTRRRGGAMIKTFAEHLEDLRASRTRATLENILSDFEQSGVRVLEEYARVVKQNLRDNPGEEGARLYFASAESMLRRHIPVEGRGRRRKTTRRRGGAMIKTIAELLEDLRASRTRATLENILSDLEQSGDRELEAHARIVKMALQRNPGEEGARIYLPITEGMLQRHLPVEGRGRRRKTTRRRR